MTHAEDPDFYFLYLSIFDLPLLCQLLRGPTAQRSHHFKPSTALTVILLTSSVGPAPMKPPAWACKLTIHYFIVMFSGLYHCWTFTRIPCKLEILQLDNSVNKAIKYSHRGQQSSAGFYRGR